MAILKNLLFRKAVFFIAIIIANFSSFEVSAKNYTRNLVIVAEPNMVYALTKIARIYSRENNVAISVSFDSSDKLIDDIDSGDDIDLLISANYLQIKALKQKAYFDVYNSPAIAFDQLRLVTLATNLEIPSALRNKKISITGAIKILSENSITLITDDEKSFLGLYRQDAINAISDNNLNLLIKSDNNEDQLNNILYNGNIYAILLASQIRNKRGLFIVNSPDQDYISYQALIIAGDNMELAREFVKFLQSSESKSILSESGFIVN